MFHWNWKWGVRFYYFTKFQIFHFIGTKKNLLWIDNDVIRRFRTKCKVTVNEFGRILLLTAMISAPAGTGSFSSFCGGCRRIITALPVGCMNRWRWIQPTNWNGLILRFRNRPFRPCVRCGSGNKNFFFFEKYLKFQFQRSVRIEFRTPAQGDFVKLFSFEIAWHFRNFVAWLVPWRCPNTSIEFKKIFWYNLNKI